MGLILYILKREKGKVKSVPTAEHYSLSLYHFCDSALKCELCNESYKRSLHDNLFHVPCSMLHFVSFLIFQFANKNGPTNSENMLFSKKSHTNNV